MRMYQCYVLAKKDGAEVWQEGEEVWECRRRRNRTERKIVDFNRREDPADAYTVWGMAVGYDYHLLKFIERRSS